MQSRSGGPPAILQIVEHSLGGAAGMRAVHHEGVWVNHELETRRIESGCVHDLVAPISAKHHSRLSFKHIANDVS